MQRNKPMGDWAIVGMLPSLLLDASNIHDYIALLLKHHGGSVMFKGPWLSNMKFLLTCDPMNLNHITSRSFTNYEKGSEFHEVFEVLGDGILNADGETWKYNRAILHSLLKQRSFGSFVQKTMQEKLDNCLLPFLDHVSKAGKHVVPHWLWKLQKWLQIGKEKLFEGSKIVDKFLHEQITSKRKQQKKCSKNQEEEPFPDLLSIIMAQEWGKGPIDDKFLRDTAVDLLAAGRDTISAGLCWFIWLVATRPSVGAKIIEEIKSNF
ncbi:hypothetical protein L6164_028919 [Bauhinia variegata]|uniref:Uncharacterized protein n=1 Tax=Bauhinia variegata TaxID=167791 RepID=A0ACB9L7X9_BAUVA|nr:hypothetical protein L6164_028919 [Bauhinia variegata]